MRKVLVGDTVTFTWVNSGVAMSPMMEIYDAGETLVGTGSFVSSGNGHYYYRYTATGSGYYVLRATGTADGAPFKRQHRIKVVAGGVD